LEAIRIVETGDSNSSTRYRGVGQIARRLVDSRYWILAVVVVALLLYLPLLFSGFLQDDYGHRVNYSPHAGAKAGLQGVVMRNGPLNLYGFSWDSPARLALQRDKGFIPWWGSQAIRINFLRPLSSLTLAFDFSLWPDTPVAMHAQSLLWFCLLIVLAYVLYRSVSGSSLVAGLSILLLAVDDVFVGPAGWISNRHALIAMVFGVLCVWLYHQGMARQRRFCAVGAYGAYVLALLASEMGVVALAYILAHQVTLDRGALWSRVKRVTPFLLITVVWRLGYSWLGYGAQGTLLYVDPVLDPVGFLSQLLTRYPLLLFSVVALPVADMLLAFSPQAVTIAAVLSFILLGVFLLTVSPVVRSHRTSAFWALGLLGAAVPLVSGIPGNRNLGFVSLGVMGLAGQLLADVADMRKTGAPAIRRMVLLKIAAPVVVMLHLVASPLLVLSNPAVTRMMSAAQARVARLGSAPELARQHVNVINPPGSMVCVPGLLERLLTDEPFPASVNYLSSGLTPVVVRRVDDRTIAVTPDGGYTLPPGPIVDGATGLVMHVHGDNVYRALEGLVYNPRNPMRVGQVVAMTNVRVEIARMTSDGRIAEAVFRFANALDDGRYLWLRWDEGTSTYEVVQMPPIGESRVYLRRAPEGPAAQH
jgi:hypothetical protein